VKVEWKRLGDIVDFQRSPIDIAPNDEYSRIGIYSWGKGMMRREPVSGTEMGAMRYFTFPIPSLIFSNIQAWEGAVALASPDDEGFVCSSRFFPYVPRVDTYLNLRYLYEFFRSAPGMTIMRTASPGTQVRNKVLSRSALENSLVPIPSRSDQDRIAAHLDSLARVELAVRPVAFDAILQRDWPCATYKLRDLVTSSARSEAVDKDKVYEMSGVKWYGQGIFVREIKTGGELSATSVRRIKAGDLVYNRLFAWKQSFALATDDGWASNEFPTFKINEELVLPRMLLAVLLSPTFTAAVNDASTGSTPTSRNRLKENDFLNLEVAIPDIPQQPAIERALIAANQTQSLLLHAKTLANTILPAARNEVFSLLNKL